MGRLRVVRREIVQVGQQGPPGPPGPPGGDTSLFKVPEQHGSAGNGVTNDRPALQAALDEAEAAGGGSVFAGGLYAWSGTLVIPPTVRLVGAGTAFSGGATGLIALDGSSRIQVGDIPAGGQSYTGGLENLIIDGNGVGGEEQLLRIESVNAMLTKVVVRNGVGDGIDLASSQNVTFHGVDCGDFPNGVALRGRNRDEAAGTQGPGGNKFFGCYFYGSDLLFKFDTTDAVNFWPHDNIFMGCLFEQYQEDCIALGHLADGETRFSHCTFTGSSGMLTVAEDCLILIDNELRPAFPTSATFDSCDFGGGSVGVSHLIRCNSFSQANLLRIYGKTQVNNAGQGYFLCDDRAGGGGGVVGGVFGAVDLQAGVGMSTGINGGSGAIFATELRQPVRFRMDATQGNPLQFRRDGETVNRHQVTRDGILQWLDGVTAVQRGAILRDGPTNVMGLVGRWNLVNGLIRSAATSTLAADGAVTINAATTSVHIIDFTAGGADATSVTISYEPFAGEGAATPIAGTELLLVLHGSSGANTVNWIAGTAIDWDGQPPLQPAAGKHRMVTLRYTGSVWQARDRSDVQLRTDADGLPTYAYGNSYANDGNTGSGSTPGWFTAGKHYLTRAKDEIDLGAVTNYAVNGTRLINLCDAVLDGTAGTVGTNVTPLAGSLWPGTSSRSGLVVVDPFFNDIAHYPSMVSPVAPALITSANTRYKDGCVGMLRTLLAVLSSESRIEQTAGTVTGTWNASAAGSGVSGGSTRTCSTVGGAIEFSVTPAQSGPLAGKVWVIIRKLSPEVGVGDPAALTVQVDGGTGTTYTPTAWEQYAGTGGAQIQSVPDAVPVTVPVDGAAHTVKLTHAGSAGQRFIVDVVTVPSEDPNPIVVMGRETPPVAGYYTSTEVGYWKANERLLTPALKAVVAEFSNAIWVPSTMTSSGLYSGDGIHPNDRGQAQQAADLVTALQTIRARLRSRALANQSDYAVL